jgi:hypothetical protein
VPCSSSTTLEAFPQPKNANEKETSSKFGRKKIKNTFKNN